MTRTLAVAILLFSAPLVHAKSSRCVPAYNVHSTYGDGYSDGFEAVVQGRLRTISPQHVKFEGRTKSKMCGRTLYLSNHMIDW
jgi:hypothetical protein